jgi:hypothetical protein
MNKFSPLKKMLCALAFTTISQTILAQGVGINNDATNPDNSAMLHVKSTTKGILVPRMLTTQRNTIAAPATGLLVFDLNTNSFWFFDGVIWTELISGVDSDNQNLGLTGNTLSLTNDATPVNLTPYLDNTDNQGSDVFQLNGNNLELSLQNDGVATQIVNLSGFINTDNQDLTLGSNILSLTNDGTTVNLAPYLDNTDNQDLALASNTLSLTNDGTTVNLAPYLDNTDNQRTDVFQLVGNNLQLSLQNDGIATQSINLSAFTNTDNQDLALASNTLSLTNDGTTVNLAPYLDNTDNQRTDVFQLVGNNLQLSLQNDGIATQSINLSAFTNTDNQDLALAGNTLSLTNDGTTVNLAPYLDNTDNQRTDVFQLVGNNLQLSLQNDGIATQSINLSAFTNTDNQDLALAGNTLSLTNDGTTVNLAPYLDNTDNQRTDVFQLVGNNLQLSLQNDGIATQSIDFSAFLDADNLGNHTATTNLNMSSNNVTNVQTVSTLAVPSYDKLRVWNSSNYTIGMNSAMTFGYLNDYATTFTMNADNDRGWIWRDVSDAKSDGAASLTTDGRFTVKSILRSQGTLLVAGNATVSSLSGTGTRMVVANAAGLLSTQAITVGDITSVAAGTGLTGGGTSGALTLNAVGTNGLNTNANDIRLGGTLIQATTITQGANNMTFNLNNTGDFIVQDNGVTQFMVQDNGDVRADNATLYVDASTDRIGIGTTAPGDKLHVVGDILLTGGLRHIEVQAGDQNIQLDDANPVWNGQTYGAVTRFFGDAVLANSKLEAGGLQLERRIQIKGGNPATGRVLTSDATGNATWVAPTVGDITGVTAGDGLIGGGTAGTVTVNVVATNGLTDNANDVRLGGTLVQATTITQGVNNMTYNLNNTGDFHIQDNGINHFSVSDNGNTAFGGDVEWRDENTGGTLLAQLFDDGNDGRFRIMENGGVAVDLDANTQFIFNEQGLDRNFRIESDANANMLFMDAGLNRMGIGTASPDNVLDVNGKLSLTQSVGDELVLINDDIWAHSTGNQDFGDGGDHFILASREGSGESAGIYGDGDHLTLWSPGDAATGQPAALIYVCDEDRYNGADTDPFNNNALEAYLNTAGNWVAASDRNRKENIVALDNSLDKILQIKGYSYNFKQTTEEIEKGQAAPEALGVIAQEVELILPRVVEKSDDGDYYVSYIEFIPVLIEALKEEHAIVDTQKEAILSLTAKQEATQKELEEIKALLKSMNK